MSKNFELMQEAGISLGSSIPEVKSAASVLDHTQKARSREKKFNLDSVAREESLKLVQRVFLSGKAGAPRVVVFCGVDPGSGCSRICAQTAEMLASHKLGSVCLVDANLRAPSLPDILGVTNHYGLSDALRERGAIRGFSKQVRLENLWLLSSGSLATESSAMVSGDGMKERISELRKEFEFVLIDAPPLNTYADGTALGQLADGVVLVLEANCTRREVASRAAENLRAAQIPILGAILNKRTYPIPEMLYRIL
jgi:capsular exopolysaccharide synthesis family protein